METKINEEIFQNLETSQELKLVENIRKFNAPGHPLSDEEVYNKLTRCGWYKLYLDADWSNVENQEAIKKMLITEYWNNGNYPRGMYIYGSIGVGKTSLMALIARWFAKYFQVNPYFIPTGMLFDTYFEKRYDEVEKLMKSSVLFLDDLGREYGADYPLSKFENFVEYRYGNLLPTFISSNLKVEDLRNRSGFERIADRINDNKWMIHLQYTGTSKRVR